MKLWHLFLAFFRVGIFGYGGGPGSIGLIKAEVVTNYQWLSDGQFAEALAFGNALPGPLATKLAAYVGYKVAGVIGALVSLLAIVVPTAVAIIALYKFFAAYSGSPRVKGALTAVKPLVVVLMLQVVLGLGKSAFPNWIAVGVAVVTGIALNFDVHPAILVAAALAFGAIFLA